MQTPFTILGVTEDADDAAIRSAYLKLVRRYSPDNAPEQFQTIRMAYERIATQRQRLRYALFEHAPPEPGAVLEQSLVPGKPGRPSCQVVRTVIANALSQVKEPSA